MNPTIAKYASMTEDEQFAAVAWGNKPMCNVRKKHDTSLPYIKLKAVVEYTLSDGTKGSYSYPEYLYYKHGLSDKAKRAAYLLNKDKTKAEHKELGLLLGYSSPEVEAWVTTAASTDPDTDTTAVENAPKITKGKR